MPYTRRGGRRRRRRRRRRRGGVSLSYVLQQAAVPASLYYLQKKQQRKRRHRSYRKYSRSKTRPGHLDFVTHLGSKVYNRFGRFLLRDKKPYTRCRRHSRRRR